MATKPAAISEIETRIPMIEIREFKLRIIGDSPLVVHAWSAKAKQMMLDKQMKVATKGKAAKDPQQDYEDCFYWTEDGSYGFPAVALKRAAVDACRFVDGVKMTEARGAFHIIGELVKIEGEPRRREDMVRVGMGTADIRYRPEFFPWAAEMAIRFNQRAMTADQIVNLFTYAGFGVGIGEHRPEKDGSWGMFHVAAGWENS